MTVPTCLKCSSTNVQKVSAVYHAGISTSYTQGQKFGYHKNKKGRWVPDVRPYSEQTTRKTHLAELLSPPEKPFFWAALVPFGLLGLLFSGWVLCSQRLEQLLGDGLAQIACFVLLCFVLVCLVPWLWAFEKQQYQEYKEAVQKWAAACRKWEELFYCAVCDTVFDPQSGKSAPVSQMQSLL